MGIRVILREKLGFYGRSKDLEKWSWHNRMHAREHDVNMNMRIDWIEVPEDRTTHSDGYQI